MNGESVGQQNTKVLFCIQSSHNKLSTGYLMGLLAPPDSPILGTLIVAPFFFFYWGRKQRHWTVLYSWPCTSFSSVLGWVLPGSGLPAALSSLTPQPRQSIQNEYPKQNDMVVESSQRHPSLYLEHVFISFLLFKYKQKQRVKRFGISESMEWIIMELKRLLYGLRCYNYKQIFLRNLMLCLCVGEC